MFGDQTINAFNNYFFSVMGKLLQWKVKEQESVEQLKDSLEKSHHSCLYCERIFSDPGEDPVCRTCHVLSIYSKDYYDTFLCNCQDSQLTGEHCQDSCQYYIGRTGQVHGSYCQKPNWIFPQILIQNLKSSNCDDWRGEEQSRTFTSLPPEIICIIFKNLDEVSLLSAKKVCKNWEYIVNSIHPGWKWKSLVLQRWPLFKECRNEPVSWLSVYFKMLESAPCVTCLLNSTGQSKLPEPNFVEDDGGDGSCSRIKRLEQEFLSITSLEVRGIQSVPLDEKKYDWMTRLVGPSNSPYEGGVFYINFKFPINYPFQVPKVRFLTKIFHPDVSRHGDLVVLDLIDPRFWTPGHTIRSLLLIIQNLLIQPHLKSDVEPLIKKLYLQDREAFNTIAKEWTEDYAMTESP